VIASTGGLGGVAAAAAPAPSLAGTPSGSTGASTGGGTANFYPSTGSLAGSSGRTRSWRDRLLLAIAIFDIALYQAWSRNRAPGPQPAAANGRIGKPPPLR
jgi:hypothetical protein